MAILAPLLAFFAAILAAVLLLFPDAEPPDLSGFVAQAGTVWGHVAWLNQYVPIDQALIGFGLLLVVWVPMYGVKVTIWLLVKSRNLGGGQ